MEHKHTPGPWLWSHRQIPNGNYSTQVYDAAGKEVATIAWYPVQVSSTITSTCREHNARLIASAPDLLEALQSAEAFIAGFEDDESQEGIRDNLLKIRAAITKATKS